MKLYNCETKEELELKEIELTALSRKKLISLAGDITTRYEDDILQDESIVVAALHEIIKELYRRDYENNSISNFNTPCIKTSY